MSPPSSHGAQRRGAERRPRVCLRTGGGYPFRRGTLGGWCRNLVSGPGADTFDLLTLTDREPPSPPVHPLPGNVASACAAAFTAPGRRGPARPGERVDTAAEPLRRGLFVRHAHDDDALRTDLATPAPATADELASAVPAPRLGPPPTPAIVVGAPPGRPAQEER